MLPYVIMFFVGLAVSLVLWIYFSVHYRRVKQDVYNEKNVDAATRKEVDRIRARDPMISCDYCGARIDTRKFLNCPRCGATYKKDLEWKYRRNADGTRVGDLSAAERGFLEEKLWKKDPRLKSLRRKILISSLPLLFALGLFIYAILQQFFLDFHRDETLNHGSTDYRSVDYQVKGDSTIYDDGKIAITVTGIYVDHGVASPNRGDDYWDGTVVIGMRITNRTKQKLALLMESDSFNGTTVPNSGFTIYDNFRRTRDTQIYVRYLDVPYEKLSEMVITKLEVRDTDGKTINAISSPLVVTTTAASESAVKLEGETPLFSDDRADVYCRYEERAHEPGYFLYIVNKTDLFLDAENETEPSGGKPYLFFYRADVPAGYVLVARAGKDRLDDAGTHPEISLMFRYPQDTAKTFSTGKLAVR